MPHFRDERAQGCRQPKRQRPQRTARTAWFSFEARKAQGRSREDISWKLIFDFPNCTGRPLQLILAAQFVKKFAGDQRYETPIRIDGVSRRSRRCWRTEWNNL